jgi:hypothetical protein
MTPLDRLRLLADALATAVEADPKFFAAIVHYTKQLQQVVRAPRDQVSLDEIRTIVKRIDDFFERWRPSDSPGVIYIPPLPLDLSCSCT